MAASVKTLASTYVSDPSNATTLAPVYRNGRERHIESGLVTVNEAQVASTIKLGWVPKGAYIVEGTVYNSALGTNTQLTLGVVGKSGTTYDNDADAFLAAYATASAAKTLFPDVASANAGTSPYQVTDPEGAYVLATVANANTAASNQTVSASITWVQD
jgi:hypothetical protein